MKNEIDGLSSETELIGLLSELQTVHNSLAARDGQMVQLLQALDLPPSAPFSSILESIRALQLRGKVRKPPRVFLIGGQ